MIILLGDSIRLGIQRNLSKGFVIKNDLFGPKENLEDSKTLKEYIFTLNIERPEKTIVHFNAGLHDIRFHRKNETLQVSKRNYQSNLREIIRYFKKLRVKRIIIATTTSFSESVHNHFRLESGSPYARYSKDLKEYNEIITQLGAEEKIECNDLYKFSNENLLTSHLTEDGLHFTEGGYCELSEVLINFLK